MRRRHEDLRMAFRPCPSRPDLLGTPYNRDWRGYRRAVTDHCVAWSAQFTRHQSLAERTPGGYRTTDGRRRTALADAVSVGGPEEAMRPACYAARRNRWRVTSRDPGSALRIPARSVLASASGTAAATTSCRHLQAP